MDFFPTLLEAANAQGDVNPDRDGISLMPLLRGSASLNRDAIYFHYPNYAFHQGNRLGSAVRAGEYKLIEYFDDGSTELYNLKRDISETQDLSEQFPDQERHLRELLHAWRKETNAAMPIRTSDQNLPQD